MVGRFPEKLLDTSVQRSHRQHNVRRASVFESYDRRQWQPQQQRLAGARRRRVRVQPRQFDPLPVAHVGHRMDRPVPLQLHQNVRPLSVDFQRRLGL